MESSSWGISSSRPKALNTTSGIVLLLSCTILCICSTWLLTVEIPRILSTKRPDPKSRWTTSGTAGDSRSSFSSPGVQWGEEECVFVIMCGTGDTDTVTEMRPLITSAMLLSSCRLRFVFMADGESVERINEMFTTELPTSIRPVSVEIWNVSADLIDEWALSMNYDPHHHHSSTWGTAKLFVPWLLKDRERVIVLDTDMVFLKDPALLWAQFYQHDDDQAGNGNNDQWLYKLPLFDTSSVYTICSCVVMMNIPNILRANILPDLVMDAIDQVYKSMYPAWYNNDTGLYSPASDQGVYFSLFKIHPHLVSSLEKRFNCDHCHYYYNMMTNSSDEQVVVLHYNCDNVPTKYDDQANVYFHFFRDYKWAWLQGGNGSSYPVQVRNVIHEGNYSLFRR